MVHGATAFLERARRRTAEARKAEADRHAANVLPIVEEVRRQGATSLHKIAAALNARKVPTARGGAWDAKAVKRVLDRQEERA